MIKANDIVGKKVYYTKVGRKGVEKVKKLGRVHMVVFSPSGDELVGYLVKRPDVAGVVKREDAFLARDAFVTKEDGLHVTNQEDGLDAAARKRLGFDWDSCVMWLGMDVVTKGGKDLGYVRDIAIDPDGWRVRDFYVGHGSVEESLIGCVEVSVDMLAGHHKGKMVVDDAAAALQPVGGAAARAGEATARAKVESKKAVAKADEASAKAVDKGSRALGKALGDTKRAFAEAKREYQEETGTKKLEPQMEAREAADVRVSAPKVAGELHRSQEERGKAPVKTYAPAKRSSGPAAKAAESKQKPQTSTKRQQPTSQDVAREAGRQIGKMGKMFGDFADEFRKASK
ncbi:PRC-barrel domain-containing protein [Olsenella porci]|uniref:PRC-barrel domain containing protein n=1 Tax=Olsenella porci TaxID=2652279 RepID=A0A6N7XK33_9ACTN|nr:PRC-barrel domain-containing protein [Olsenella porci]MST71578.1 PRC-barrel domain containing protein [Olsenella porci]